MGLKELGADGDVVGRREGGGAHGDVCHGGEIAHEEALARAEELEKSAEAKRALRQANLSPERPAVSTSGAAYAQARSIAPRRQRRRWNNPCSSRLTVDFCSISIQTILLVVFLPVFRDELAHETLQAWVIGTGTGCLLLCTYKRFRKLQSKRLPQALLPVSPGSEVAVESQTGPWQRVGIQILKWFCVSLDGFFPLGIGVGIGIVYTRWVTGQAPHLNWPCTLYLVIAYFPFILVMTACVITCVWLGISGAKANVIWALSTHKFHAQVSDLEANQAINKEDDDDVMGVTIGGDETRVGALAAAADQVVECCVCLDPYEDGMELKELPCTHRFHVKCIDRWLKINGSCPICKSEVGSTLGRASATEPAFTTVMV